MPATLSFSLEGFLRRGGETDEHADGWGIAYYESEKSRCQLLIDEVAAARSEMGRWVRQQHPERSVNIIAHIRKATRGAVRASNCHPFVRSFWGQEWSFAHNGTLDLDRLSRPLHEPVGDTDSEQAFCLILDALHDRFGDVPPELSELREALQDIAGAIAVFGVFNFILSNGRFLFAHRASSLHYVQRVYPFGEAHLLDCPIGIDFSRHNRLEDRMVIIATKPLTDEVWQPLPAGEVVVFSGGQLANLDAPVNSGWAFAA